MSRRAIRMLLTSAGVLLALAALVPARAAALIYWGDEANGRIGRAELTGTGVNEAFVTGSALGPCGVAVDAGHVYWGGATFVGGRIDTAIGRAGIDGSNPIQGFIPIGEQACGVAVSGTHVYWAHGGAGSGAIGRANLDGTGADENFIPGASRPEGVAVDGGHVYWSNLDGRTIGRANLDGTGADQRFVVTTGRPCGVAVQGGFLYWTSEASEAIARAGVDGTGVDEGFVPDAGADCGVAADAGHLYWPRVSSGFGGGQISRSALDGTNVTAAFIGPLALSSARWLAVDARTGTPPPPPPPSFTLQPPARTPDPRAGEPFTGPVAHIADSAPGTSAAAFAATIAWGDGGHDAGTIVPARGGSFDVTGTHAYPSNPLRSSFNLVVTATKAGASRSLEQTINVAPTRPRSAPQARFDVVGDPFGQLAQFPVHFDASASGHVCANPPQDGGCLPTADGFVEYDWTVDGVPKACLVPKLAVVFPKSHVAHVELTVVDLYGQRAAVAHDYTIRETQQGTPHPIGDQPDLQCGEGTYRFVDLHAQGLEVTQAVQPGDAAHPFPVSRATATSNVWTYSGLRLAAGHDTVARLYADAGGAGPAPVAGVDARLYGYDAANRALPGSPLMPVGGPHTVADHGSPTVTWSERSDPTEPFAFILPPSWTTGTIRLEGELIAPADVLQTECAGCLNTTTLTSIRFEPTRSITITPVRLTYPGSDPPTPYSILSAPRAVMPVHWATPDYQGTIDISGPVKADESREDRAGDVVDLLEDWALFSGRPVSFPVVGISRGFRDPTGQMTDLGVTTQQAISVVNADRPLSSVAHELGHTLGRLHASASCGGGDNGQRAEGWPPDEIGALQGFGFDTRPGPPSNGTDKADKSPAGGTFRLYPDPGQTDYMSYCSNGGRWASVRGWNETFVTDRGAAGRAGARIAGKARPGLLVSGFVSSSGVHIGTIVPRGTTAVGAPPPRSSLHLVERARNGRVLADVPIATSLGHVDGAPSLQLFSAVAPDASAASVDVVRDGAVVAHRTRSAHAPSVQLTAPQPGAVVGRGSAVALSWRAADPDHDRLTVTIEYSADAGRHWKTVSVGADTGRASLPSRLLTAARDARLRLRVCDGFNETSVTSGAFRSVGAPPAVTITSPGERTRIADDASLTLRGEAYDDAARSIPAAGLRWFDGHTLLGRGTSIAVTGLRPGPHAIRLVARDGAGRTGAAAVSVQVDATPPSFLAVRAPASIDRRARELSLRVAASLPATLRVGAQRFPVSRRARTVTLRVRSPGARRPLALVLELEAWGKRTRATLTVARR